MVAASWGLRAPILVGVPVLAAAAICFVTMRGHGEPGQAQEG
ncbi:hypothetical protein ACFMQL_11480 [Nonomuraea fastidiosa]